MNSRRRSIIALALTLALAAMPSFALAQNPNGGLAVPIEQTLTGVGTFTGQLVVNSFKIVDGQLMALGTLSGRLVDTAGNLIGTVATALAVPVAGAGSCSILHLTLGPLDLDLLGLKVHLDRVVLDITAQQGPGNLLGNLLCSIANLLNAGGPLSQLANLLNQLLAAL